MSRACRQRRRVRALPHHRAHDHRQRRRIKVAAQKGEEALAVGRDVEREIRKDKARSDAAGDPLNPEGWQEPLPPETRFRFDRDRRVAEAAA